jgi:hypothetical protein
VPIAISLAHLALATPALDPATATLACELIGTLTAAPAGPLRRLWHRLLSAFRRP